MSISTSSGWWQLQQLSSRRCCVSTNAFFAAADRGSVAARKACSGCQWLPPRAVEVATPLDRSVALTLCFCYRCMCRYYGCGSPFPVGLQGSGLRVLDLGCGTGRDCYVCAALVGEKGFVTGEQAGTAACTNIWRARMHVCTKAAALQAHALHLRHLPVDGYTCVGCAHTTREVLNVVSLLKNGQVLFKGPCGLCCTRDTRPEACCAVCSWHVQGWT